MNMAIKTYSDKKELPLDSTTVGYWNEDEQGVTIWIHTMSDWRFMVAVLFHELIEWALTKHRGVTTAQCDAFDDDYEEQYRNGRNKAEEPGDDPDCPYFEGHQFGNHLEWTVIFILGASWKDYLKECGEICECEY